MTSKYVRLARSSKVDSNYELCQLIFPYPLSHIGVALVFYFSFRTFCHVDFSTLCTCTTVSELVPSRLMRMELLLKIA